MSLDFYPRQKVAFVEMLTSCDRANLVFHGCQCPVLNAVYTVSRAWVCDDCGNVHITVSELEPDVYPPEWFRPVEPGEMSVLRGLLTPAGGMPAAPLLPTLIDLLTERVRRFSEAYPK